MGAFRKRGRGHRCVEGRTDHDGVVVLIILHVIAPGHGGGGGVDLLVRVVPRPMVGRRQGRGPSRGFAGLEEVCDVVLLVIQIRLVSLGRSRLGLGGLHLRLDSSHKGVQGVILLLTGGQEREGGGRNKGCVMRRQHFLLCGAHGPPPKGPSPPPPPPTSPFCSNSIIVLNEPHDVLCHNMIWENRDGGRNRAAAEQEEI